MDVVCYNLVTDVYVKTALWERALECIIAIQQEFLTPNLVSYCIAVQLQARHNDWQGVLQTLRSLYYEVLQPDLICYNAAMDRYVKSVE